MGLADEEEGIVEFATRFHVLAKTAIFGLGAGQLGMAYAAVVVWWKVRICVSEGKHGQGHNWRTEAVVSLLPSE